MKILFLSPDQCNFSLATRLQDEGHQVIFWTNDKEPPGNGFVKIFSGDWKPLAKSVDLVITDDVILDNDSIQDLHKPVVSGNDLFSKLENDRLFGKWVFKKYGLDVSDCIQFNDFKKAIEFVKKEKGRWVFKANGQASRTLGFVSKDESGKDMIERLSFYESHLRKNKKLWDKKLGVDFVLERAVDGIEVACGAYWDGQDFAGLNINWEHKRLGVGNIGVATGEMGTAVHAMEPTTRLYHSTLEKLKPLLQMYPYSTDVDLNCIVTKDKAYVLEITSRFGWPSEACYDNMCALDTGTRYASLAMGKLHTNWKWRRPWGVVVNVGTFGFPYETAYKELGQEQPFSIPEEFASNIYLCGVDKLGKQLQTSKSGEGLVMAVAACSDTLSGARERVYQIIEKIDLPGKMYRTDIGEKVPEHIKQLKQWGWI